MDKKQIFANLLKNFNLPDNIIKEFVNEQDYLNNINLQAFKNNMSYLKDLGASNSIVKEFIINNPIIFYYNEQEFSKKTQILLTLYNNINDALTLGINVF